MGRCLRGLIAASLIVQLSGCSFLFVHRAPPGVPPGVWVDCTEGKTWPIVDAVFGTSMLIGAVGGGATSGSTNTDGTRTSNAGVAVAAGVDALVAIGVLYSAYAGFKWTNRCSRLHEDAEARGIYGPQPYNPYPPPYGYPPPQQPPPQGPPGSTTPAPQPQPQPQPQPVPQ